MTDLGIPMNITRLASASALALTAFAPIPSAAQETWTPPIGIPAPPFGIHEVAPAPPRPWALPTAGFYYVDASKVNAIDVANPFGTPLLPRRTIPADLPAGAVVELHGTYETPQTSPFGIKAAGTAARPVFIRGVTLATGPLVVASWEVSGSYVVIENIRFAFRDAVKGAFAFLAPVHHAVLRNCDVRGNLNGGGVTLASYTAATGSHLVVYKNRIHDNGNIAATFDQDIHGIVVGGAMSQVWVLENELFRNSGDGVQINSGGSSHHIYVGRNTSHHNKQNGLWCKRASDVIFSENHAYAHRPSDSSFGAGLGMQYGPERVWFLYNRVHDCETGIGIASDLEDGRDGLNSYIIGNVIHNIHASSGFDGGSAWSSPAILLVGTRNRNVVNNTIHDVDSGISSPVAGGVVHIVNNIVAGVTNPAGSHIFFEHPATAVASTMHHNLLGGVVRIKWGGNSPIYSLSGFQSQFGKGQGSTNATPKYVDLAGRDFRLDESSPGVDAGVASAVYATFRTRYGLDIARDREGTERPHGLAWDVGAFEVPGPPSPEIRIDDVSMTEGDGALAWATLTVSLSLASARTVTVDYTTADDTAQAGSDYVAASGTLTFPPGVLSRPLAVLVRRDNAAEANESFFVELEGAVGGTIADGQGRVTIVDDDPPALSIGDLVVTEGRTGIQSAIFTVTLSTPSTGPIAVSYATGGGSAVAGTDYVPVASRLSLPPGATSGRITVLLRADAADEPEETFFVTLGNPSGATIAKAQGMCTIRDDAETVAWIDAVGVKTSGNSLVKTAPAAWGNAGAVSNRALAFGNGFVEFTVSETNTSRMLGLSNGQTDHRFGDIDFAIACNALGELHVYERGVDRGTFGRYAIGDRLRVAVGSGRIRYYRNGRLMHTSTVIPVHPLLVDTSFHGQGASITGAVLSGTLVSVQAPNERVAWTAGVGVSAASNNLTKTAARGWGNAGAASTRAILSGDGYLEFTADETNTYRVVGLGSGNTNQTLADVDHGIQASGVGRLLVYEKGLLRGQFGAYATGDRLRVAVVSGVVRYYRNGELFYTSTVAPSYPLTVDSALYSQGATIKAAVLAGHLGSPAVAQR